MIKFVCVRYQFDKYKSVSERNYRMKYKLFENYTLSKKTKKKKVYFIFCTLSLLFQTKQNCNTHDNEHKKNKNKIRHASGKMNIYFPINTRSAL